MVERIRSLIASRELTPTQFADTIGVARPIISHILSGRNKPSLDVVQRILAAMPDLSMPWLLNGIGSMHAPIDAAKANDAVTATQPASEIAGVASQNTAVIEPLQARTSSDAQSVKSTETAPDTFAKAARTLPLPSFKKFAAIKQDPATASLKYAAAPPQMQRVAEAPPIAAISNQLMPESQLGAVGRAAVTAAEGATADLPVPTVPTASSTSTLLREAAPDSLPEDNKPDRQGGGISMPEAQQLLVNGGKSIRRIVIFYRDGSFADFQPE